MIETDNKIESSTTDKIHHQFLFYSFLILNTVDETESSHVLSSLVPFMKKPTTITSCHSIMQAGFILHVLVLLMVGCRMSFMKNNLCDQHKNQIIRSNQIHCFISHFTQIVLKYGMQAQFDFSNGI